MLEDKTLVSQSWVGSHKILTLYDVILKCRRSVNPTPAHCTTAERMLKYANASVADMYIRQRVQSSSPNTKPFGWPLGFLTLSTFIDQLSLKLIATTRYVKIVNIDCI